MSEGAPSSRFPRTIDPRRLAHLHSKLEGQISSLDLPRFTDATHSIDDIFVSLDFCLDEEQRRIIMVRIRSRFEVICQRCLMPMTVNKETESEVALIWNEDEAKHLPKRYDPWVVATTEADIYELIEEELLLNLDVVSFHDYDCVDGKLMSSGEIVNEDAGAVDNPFNVLAQLRKREPD